MKTDIFNQYVDKVTSRFNLSKEELFSKSKKRECVDARHMLYYLCYIRPMRIKYIQDYMNENGYAINHSAIIYGISSASDRMLEDRDYKTVVKSIEECVTID
jgi:chromosomal replication initiation ATPase DnaA